MDSHIAHISDLHLSTPEAHQIFELAVTDIKSFRPALVIVTGDLVDNPWKEKLETARQKLEALCKDCGIDPSERLVVIPGNHDYRWLGLFNRETVRTTSFRRVFDQWHLPKFLQVNGRHLAIFCFDSNTNSPATNFARGRVGMKEYARFSADYNKLRDTYGSQFDGSFKIALLHHHPMPIADTETGQLLERDAFLSLEDAGTFMHEMAQRKIDLVLHGHRHCAFFARVKFLTPAYGEREVSILAAGSASKPSPGKYGNAYNLIKLGVDGTIKVEQRHRTMGNYQQRLQTFIINYEGSRDRGYDDASLDYNISLTSQTHHVLIDEFGDSQFVEEYRYLRVRDEGEGEASIPIEKRTTTGTYRGFAVFSRTSHMGDPRWEMDPASTDRHAKGNICFSQGVNRDTGPVSFDLTYHCFNSFALTVEQHQQMYGNQEPERCVFLARYPVRTLCITINYPYSSPMKATWFNVLVFNKDGRRSVDEENWCRQYLHVSELTKTATLIVDKPLVGYKYGMSWQLPHDVTRHTAEVRGRARLIRDRLLNTHPLGTSTRPTGPLQESLEGIKQEIMQSYAHGAHSIELDVGLMVYDESIMRLRHVAGVMDEAYWRDQLCEGEGVAGRAHKLNMAHLYVRSMAEPGRDWYTRPPDALPPHQVVFSVPLRYPVEETITARIAEASPGIVVAILGFASASQGSGLERLWDNKKEIDTLIYHFHQEYLLKRILPAIGLISSSEST